MKDFKTEDIRNVALVGHGSTGKTSLAEARLFSRGAADAAIVVVCAASGVEVGTEHSWAFADERSLPRMVVVNRMDRENADFFQTLSQLQSFFGKKCAPLQLPIGAQSSFEGVVDLLTLKGFRGEKGSEGAVPDSLSDQVARSRAQRVEA